VTRVTQWRERATREQQVDAQAAIATEREQIDAPEKSMSVEESG
jgi:hypothetical protein